MRGVIYLAWRYLAHYRIENAVLAAAITLVLFLPGGLRALVRASEAELDARAQATPLLIGRKGSPLELVLASLYFSGHAPESLSQAELRRVAESGLAAAIPLQLRFRAQGDRIVGTSLDYFDLRALRVARGRQMTRLGDCVLGARVAARRGIGPGDHVLSSPASAFDPAGASPLKMRVTGVLAASGGADDDAIFVDLATTWVIEGLAHGHAELHSSEVLVELDGHAVADASVRQWNEVTDENLASFHFHGDEADYPLSAVIALPRDERSATLLMGRYAAPDDGHMILRPAAVVAELFATVLTVEGFVLAALALVGLATLAVAALVFALSLRMRRREIETMVKLGGARGRIFGVLAAEVAGVLLGGLLLAALLTAWTGRYGPELVQRLMR